LAAHVEELRVRRCLPARRPVASDICPHTGAPGYGVTPGLCRRARIFPLDGRGKVNDDGAAQVAVSGDGSHVAYFRQSDGRLAVEEVGGAVRRLSASVVPGSAADRRSRRSTGPA
jgi:hypothetical protein